MKQQVEETVKVMGGEDWSLWLNFLKEKFTCKGTKLLPLVT